MEEGMNESLVSDGGELPSSSALKDTPVFHPAVFIFSFFAFGLGVVFPLCWIWLSPDHRLSPTATPPPPLSSFLYVNDIHLDPLYRNLSRVTDGSQCRTDTENPVAAYPFGQYGCDCPEATFRSMLKRLPAVVKSPDFILFGGDALAHSTHFNRTQIQDVFRSVIDGLSSVYPGKTVLLTIGNNEFLPNYGTFETDSLDFQSLSEVMRPFLSDIQIRTFQTGGYYYHDLAEKKLRLLLLNSCIYSTVRGYSNADPYGQFEWIVNSCVDARRLGFGVGIAMHIPPGVSYINASQGWPIEYITRFDEICKDHNILFILCGHTHYDMLMPVFGIDGKSRAYSLSSPSISPQHSNNPAFRVIEYDTTGIRNIRQYYADLLMNPQAELDWELEYQFTGAYSINDLSVDSLLKVVNWVTTTGIGSWAYKEKVGARASENGAFYYCILKATTTEQIQGCMAGLQGQRELASVLPYGGAV
jgi:sphingomyelin phosphodiesterase acid-like 3